MRFPVLTRLEDYWNEIRGTRPVPARSEIDPRLIEDCLEYAFIVERIAPGIARFRLAGMHLNDLMGMEVRGMPLTTFFVPEGRKKVGKALDAVFDGPSSATLSLSGERGVGRPPMDGRLLLLPLKSDFGDVTRALGCLVTLGPIGRIPRRFAVKETRITSILSDRPEPADPVREAAWRGAHPPTGQEPPVAGPGDFPEGRPAGERHPPAGFSEPSAPFDGGSDRPRIPGRPHLYLIKSDE